MVEFAAKVAAVRMDTLGSETTSALVATDTLIPVVDSGDFDESGGSVLIAGEVYTYSELDEGDESGVPSITLDAPGLTGAVAAETRVDSWNPSAANGAGAVEVDWVADVIEEGTDVDGGAGEASIDHSLVSLIGEGMPLDVGKSVTVRDDGNGDWTVINIRGEHPYMEGSIATDKSDQPRIELGKGATRDRPAQEVRLYTVDANELAAAEISVDVAGSGNSAGYLRITAAEWDSLVASETPTLTLSTVNESGTAPSEAELTADKVTIRADAGPLSLVSPTGVDLTAREGSVGTGTFRDSVDARVTAGAAGAVPAASETVEGKAEIATQAEVDAGDDDARIVTSLKLQTKLEPTYTKRVTATMSPVLDWTGRRVLWLGTSIPHQGVGADSYPELATKALGATVVNNAWSGSHATYNAADSPTDLATIKALSMTEDDRQAGLTLHGGSSVYDDSFDAVTKASQMTADYRIGNQIASTTPPSVVILDHNHNDRMETAGTLAPPEVSITGITKGATTTVTLTSAAGYAVGDGIALRVVGIDFLDHAAARVQAIAGNDVTINVDSTGYAGTFTSGTAIELDRTTQYGSMEFLLHYIQWRAVLAGVTVTTLIASAPSEYTVDGTYHEDIYTNARNWEALAAKWGIGFFDAAARIGIDETTHPVYFPDLIHPTTSYARAALAAHWVTWLSGGALSPQPSLPALADDTYTDGLAAVYDRYADAFVTGGVQVGTPSTVLTEDFVSIADWTAVNTGSAPVVEAAPWGGGDSSAKFVATTQTSYIRRDPITTDEGFSCEFDVYLPTVAGLTASGVKTIDLAAFKLTGSNQVWHTIQLIITPTGTRIRSAYFTGLTGSGGVQVVPSAETFWLSAATKHTVTLEAYRATGDHAGGVILTVDGDRLTFPADTTDTIWSGTPGRFEIGILSSNVENSVTVYTGNLTVSTAPVQDPVDAFLAERIADPDSLTRAALNNQSAALTDRITTGQEVYPRGWQYTNALSQTSGTLKLTFFTAYKTETIASLRTYAGAVAAGATPTLCRVGLYSVDPSTGDLTLVASTPNTTSLWATANTAYTTALSASVDVTAGTRYAIGFLCVTAATVPQMPGNTPNLAMSSEAPRLSAQVGSQTDLPATVTAAAQAALAQRIYAELIP